MVTYQQLGYMKQHIDAATLQVLLMLFEMPDAYLESLVQLPAAANLSIEYVISLLLAAGDAKYRRTGFSGVRVLCQLPAAQHLDTAAVLQLLQAAIQQGCVPWHLCELPAAQQLSNGEVLQLLQAAVQLGMDDTNELAVCQALSTWRVLRCCSCCRELYKTFKPYQAFANCQVRRRSPTMQCCSCCRRLCSMKTRIFALIV
jgi:hypothetical protein